VVADVLGFPRSMHQAIHQQVTALTNQWAFSDFILAATHTHNGPVLVGSSPDPFISYNLTDLSLVTSYSDWLQSQIVSLVSTALAAPQTACTLDYKVATQSFSMNREGLSYIETAVPVLVARKADNTPAAVLFSYGTHCVSAGLQNQWDGDFASGACTVVENAIPGCMPMFLTGPAGDQDPTGTHDWARRTTVSNLLGNAVVTAAGTAGRSVTGPILTNYREVTAALDVTVTPANLAAVRAIYVQRQSNMSLFSWYRRHATTMIQRIDTNTFGTSVIMPLQVWKLSGTPLLRIALVGGELVSGYAAYFRPRYGGTDGLLIGGYAAEIPAYIPSNELLPPLRAGGSYAGGWDTDAPGIAGGSMTVYGQIGHFPAGTNGIENTVITNLTSMLN
jgi:hypothetical protein